jgi:N-acylglucosamine 2-epimerase
VQKGESQTWGLFRTRKKLRRGVIDTLGFSGDEKEFGGMLYFRDVKGLSVQEYWHYMKFWWPHNETIIATLPAYELTGGRKYLSRSTNGHSLISLILNTGEWYGCLHRNGTISIHMKGNIRKGPFHIPGMYFKAWRICEDILSKQ